jgi:osmotically-inducible protein OsmY
MLNSRQAVLLVVVSVAAGVMLERGIADTGTDRYRVRGAGQTSGVVDSRAGALASFLDDAQITALVKTALISEFGIGSRSIHVDTADSVVTLSGDVGTPLQHDIAMQIASDTDGVSDVVDAVSIRDMASVDFWPAQSGHVRSLQETI